MKTKKIMLIDDNRLDTSIHKQLLAGFVISENIIEINSPAVALEYFKYVINPEALPDIIFLEIKMREMSGFDFLKKFSESSFPKKANCQIFVITASTNPCDIDQAMSNKYVKKCFSKPFTKEQCSTIELM